jgi:hypothetical protein
MKGEGARLPEAREDPRDLVGPVLQRGALSEALIAAIRARHPDMVVLDRGSYLRVLVPRRCVLKRTAVEEQLGRPFRLPAELEAVMSSFKGRFHMSDDEASWELVQP